MKFKFFYLIKIKLPVFFLICFQSFTACSQSSEREKNSVVLESNNQYNNDLDKKEEEQSGLMAFAYEGQGFVDNVACTLFITKNEQTDESGSVELSDGKIYAKLDQVIHGEKPVDVPVQFFKYRPDLNKFFDKDSNEPGTVLVLLSILLKDEKDGEVMDPNKILGYEQNGQLIQFLRIDLNENEDPDRAILKIEHLGHYDASACLNLNYVGSQKVNFNLTKQSEGHRDDDQ